MKNILLIGAGRSTISLIDYLIDNLEKEDWNLTVADQNIDFAKSKIGSNSRTSAIQFDVNNEEQRSKEIGNADIIISMLPAHMHISVAKDCIKFKKNMVTASYVSKEMRALESEAIKNGVTIINEIGVDPGIDHLSAMKVIDEIRAVGGEILEFETFTGGLVAPESDDNPWNYKFTWNPRNVVLAGQGTAQYIENGDYKYIPYTSLFERTEQMEVLDAGEFEGYANRDSLSYRKSYGLKNIPTLFRGTLRRKGYSEAWNVFVQLGMTDDTYKLENSASITNREFINMFLPFDDALTVEEKLCKQFNLTADSVIFQKIAWLGIFSENKSGIKDASPAQILQEICESKWTLGAEDKDMIVMQHQFEYFQNGEQKKLNSSLLVFGDDPRYTSMAKTVGLPVAIATKLILNGEINSTGIKIPTTKDIYVPVLKELEENGINFVEELV